MPLRLAFLGFDADSLALARQACESGEFVIGAFSEADPPAEILRAAPQAVRALLWESLLLESQADVVMIARAGDRERRAEQLRKLAQARIPLLVAPATCEALVGFEIEMIRRDVNGLIVPYLPEAHHPAMAQLARLAGPDSPLGTIEQVVCERQIADRGRDEVLAWLARDSALFRNLLGNIARVSAMGTAADSSALSNLSVHLTGPSKILARWSVGPVEKSPQGEISLLGTQGKATLVLPLDGSPWCLAISSQEERGQTWPAESGIAATLDDLSATLSGREPSYSWLNACRDIELAEAAQRSMLRGRTIELYEEEHTEQGTFKGVMSVWGCLLLMLAFFGILASFAVGGLQMLLRDPEAEARAPAEPWPLWLRLWPVYPLAAFLLLQLLQFVFLSPKPQNSGSGKKDARESAR